MSTENLMNPEARKKMTEMVEDIKFAMMATNLGSKPMDVIPMTVKKVDEQGDIWFLSSRKSEHNKNISSDNEIQLMFNNPSEMEFLSVFGKATVTTDPKILKEMYNGKTDIWFEGPDDPNLTAIKVRALDAYYWDSKSNKYVTLLKMGIAAATGKNRDIGEKGRLDV